MIIHKRCGNCRYWVLGKPPRLPGEPGGPEVPGVMACHVEPPKWGEGDWKQREATWIPTDEGDWCGRWELIATGEVCGFGRRFQ